MSNYINLKSLAVNLAERVGVHERAEYNISCPLALALCDKKKYWIRFCGGFLGSF